MLTLACAATIAENWLHRNHISIAVARGLIAAGSVLTCITRTRTIVRDLNAPSEDNHA